MRSIICYLYAALCFIKTWPKRLKARAYRKKGDTKGLRLYATQVAQQFARSIFSFSGSTVDVIGLDNIPKDRAVLFVSNHQGHLDYAVLLGYVDRPKGFIALHRAKSIPIIRKWMMDLDCIFLDRSNIKQAVESIYRGVELLRSGWSMVIFPEGRRSQSSRIAPFKAGGFKLASKAKVPIIPVTIDGTYKIIEANNNFIAPAHVRLTIHPMVETANLKREELKSLPAKVGKIIASALK